MEEWYCFKCREKVVTTDVEGEYLEVVRYVEALQCPKCKAAFLTEQTAMEVVRPGEEQIENKF